MGPLRIAAAGALLWLVSAPAKAAPTINPGEVYNNASWARDGALNRGIAQGSRFVICGQGLGPETPVQAQGFPLVKELAGTSIKVTFFGMGIDAYPLYVSASQIVALLPSEVSLGQGSVTVTVQGETSAPASITVVRRSFGIFTLNEKGSGPAMVQNVISETEQTQNTLLAPARPGQTVIMSGTGLGAVSNEADGPAPGNLSARIMVYVGGIMARLRYSGRSDCCAGIDQLVFDIPQGVQGCYVPVQVVGPGLLSTRENATIPLEHTVSNSVTIPVANDRGVCTDPTGLTGAELASMQDKGTARIGWFSFTRRPSGIREATEDSASAQFAQFDAAPFLRSRGIFGLPAFGSCLQYQVNTNELDSADPVGGVSLDAGDGITVTGPAGMRQLTRNASGGYSAAPGGAAYLERGDYTLAASGGPDIGAFEARFTVPPAPIWTNRDPSALEHSFSPTFNWDLAGPANYVIAASYGRNDLTAFYTVCTEDPAARTVNIPPYVYAGLVMHTSAAPGVVWIAAGNVSRFEAPGLDFGLINVVIGTQGVFVP